MKIRELGCGEKAANRQEFECPLDVSKRLEQAIRLGLSNGANRLI